MERRRRYGPNLVMGVMVVILALVVWIDPGSDGGEPSPRLLTIDPATITTITIERPDRKPLRLEKEGDRWWLRSPYNLPAHGYRVASLLKLTESRSLGSHPVEGRDLRPFGLAPPQVVVTLNDTPGIAFGYPTPLDNRRYLLLGDQFHMVTDTLFYQLVSAPTSFISLRLLPEGTEPAELQLPEMALKKGDDGWQVSPEPADYSADQTVALLERWRHAEAIEVKPYDGQAGKRLSIGVAGGDSYDFLVTAEQPDLVLARPELGIEYHLAASQGVALLSLAQPEAVEEPLLESFQGGDTPHNH